MNLSSKDSVSLALLAAVTENTGTIPFSEGMLLYWNIEGTLREIFDIQTFEGQASYAAWLLVNQNELPGLYVAAHARRFPFFADSVKQSIHIGGEVFLPAVLYAVWKSREDLHNAFDLLTEVGQAGLCGNLFLHSGFSAQLAWILKDYLAVPVFEAGGLPRILYALWLTRSDLQTHFPFEDGVNFKQKVSLWAKLYGYKEYPWLETVLNRSGALPEETEQSHFPATPQMQESLISPVWPFKSPGGASEAKESCGSWKNYETTFLSHGVNLVGYAFAPSGLGMDLRMVATALEYARIPFCVINAPMRTPSPASELAFQDRQTEKPLYDTTLFCLPCGEIYRTVCMLGENYFAGQYLIGQMPWEFSSWPPAQTPILHLLHEAWCLSGFIQQALAPVCPVPFRLMPRPVVYEPQPEQDRATLGLPEDAYTFLFMWDGLSRGSRKNPRAVIRAFEEAFTPAVRNVSLVLKTQHSFYDKGEENLSAAIAKDDRIRLIEGSLTQQQVWGLYAICDAYVALHRSEGFGLSLAEAMLAEKPVIASAYSGNLDFCTNETALLVPGLVVPVSLGAYPLAENQEWFDADVHEAARLMRYCYENRQEVRLLAQAGRDRIRTHYGLAACAKRYADRLEEIWNRGILLTV